MCQAILNGPWSVQCYQLLDLFSLNLYINLWKLIFFPDIYYPPAWICQMIAPLIWMKTLILVWFGTYLFLLQPIRYYTTHQTAGIHVLLPGMHDWASSDPIGWHGFPVQAFTPRLRFHVSAWPIIMSCENMTISATPQDSSAKNPSSDWVGHSYVPR